MPAADKSLDAIYTSERPDGDHLRVMMKEVAEDLHHCHKNGIIHCDLKMLNVVRVNGRMKLIDFDAATVHDGFAGSKFSSGILPPEMFHKLKTSEEGEKTKKYWSAFTDVEAMTELWKKVRPKGLFCVKSFYDAEGPASKDLPYDLVHASPQLDIWSYGVMLYTLCAGDSLLRVSRDGDLEKAIDMQEVAMWSQESIEYLVSQKSFDPVITDLLLKLLEPDPTKRPQSMRKILMHPYFQPLKDRAGGDIQKFIIEMNDRTKEMNDRSKRKEEMAAMTLELVLKLSDKIETVASKTLAQIHKTERILLRAMFEVADVITPSSFVIVNHKLQPVNLDALTVASLDDTSMTRDASNSLRFLRKLSALGSAVSKMAALQEGKVALSAAMRDLLTEKKFYLYLLDEMTMKPVVIMGDKYYPIEITTPAVFIPKVLPLMKVGLKAVALLNGASGIARLLGYPLPSVPEEYMEMARKAVGDLSQKSSIAEFDILQDSLDSELHGEGENAERMKNSARGAPMREFARFLLEKDPKCTFSGLRRVATPSGECCWTTDEGVAAIREEGRLEEEQDTKEFKVTAYDDALPPTPAVTLLPPPNEVNEIDIRKVRLEVKEPLVNRAPAPPPPPACCVCM